MKENIKQLRQAANLTQEGAAKALKLHTNNLIAPDARTIRRWENGETKTNKIVLNAYKNMLTRVSTDPQKKLSDEMREILHDLPRTKQAGFKAAIRFIRARGL